MAKAVSGVHKHVVSDVLFMRRCIRCPDLHCRGTARPGYPNREKMWRKWGKRKYRKWWYQFRPHTRTSISSLLQHSYLTMPENGVASSQKNKLHLHAIMMRSYSSPPCLCFSFSSPPFHIGFFGSFILSGKVLLPPLLSLCMEITNVVLCSFWQYHSVTNLLTYFPFLFL